MPAIESKAVVAARDAAVHQLAKRNWASQEAGVIVVFCIVFIVAVGLLSLWLSRLLARRKAARMAKGST